VETIAGPGRDQAWSVFLRATAEDLKTAGARASLQLAFMANQAYAMLHAIGITLVRLGITQRRLLQWETAAASATRGGPPNVRVFLRGRLDQRERDDHSACEAHPSCSRHP